MGADWTIMIDRASDVFAIILTPTAILFGVGVGMWILDWLLGTFGSGAGGFNNPTGSGGPMMHKPPGRLGPVRASRKQRPPTWRDEPYYTTDSWSVLEDRARTVNGWNPDDDD